MSAIVLLTIPEAQKALRISRAALYRLIKENRIRTIMVTPGRRVIAEREVKAYLQSCAGRRVA